MTTNKDINQSLRATIPQIYKTDRANLEYLFFRRELKKDDVRDFIRSIGTYSTDRTIYVLPT